MSLYGHTNGACYVLSHSCIHLSCVNALAGPRPPLTWLGRGRAAAASGMPTDTTSGTTWWGQESDSHIFLSVQPSGTCLQPQEPCASKAAFPRQDKRPSEPVMQPCMTRQGHACHVLSSTASSSTPTCRLTGTTTCGSASEEHPTLTQLRAASFTSTTSGAPAHAY